MSDIGAINNPGGAGGGASLSGVTLSGNTSGVLAVISTGTMTLVGGNNITLSQAGNAVTISAGNAGGGNFTAGISGGNTSGNTGTVSNEIVFAGGNNVTLSGSTNAGGMTVTVSAFNQTVQTQNLVDVSLSGNTSGALALISSGTMTIAGGNNITLSQAGNAVTISGPNTAAQSVETLGIYASSQTVGQSSSSTYDARSLSIVGSGIASVGWSNSSFIINVPSGGGAGFTAGISGGNTSGNTGTVASQIVFAGGNNITLSGSTNGGSMTVTVSAASTSFGTCSGAWLDGVAAGAYSPASAASLLGNMIIWPFTWPGYLSGSQANCFFSVNPQTSATSNSTGAGSISISFGFFTRNISTLNSVSSGSTSFAWTYTSNNSTGNLSGNKGVSIPINVNMTPGDYWCGWAFSSSSSGNLSYAISGVFKTQVLASAGYNGQLGSAAGSGKGIYPFWGMLATAGTFVTSMSYADLSGSNSNHHVCPAMHLLNFNSF
jgi:hypothetical protein